MPRTYLFLITILLAILLAGCSSISDSGGVRANDPNLSQAHIERAKFFRAQGELNKSIQEMEWAVAADPYNFEAVYHLGLLYLDQNQRLSARRVWEHGISSAQDEVERPDKAKYLAAMQAGLAELERLEKPWETPVAILSRQNAYPAPVAVGSYDQGSISSSSTTTATITSSTTGSVGTVLAPLPVTSSRPGMPATTSGASVAFAPKPYVPSPQDGKPAARSSSSTSRTTVRSDCPPCTPQATGKYAVQVSSNRQRAIAEAEVKRLNAKGHQASVAVNNTANGTWYVVWAGCCVPQDKAKALLATLIKQGFPRDARVAIPK